MMKQTDASSFLTQEELENINNVTSRTPDEDLTFARVIAVKQLQNPNAESDIFYVADDDVGSSRFLRSLSEAENIFVSNQKVTYPVHTSAIAWAMKYSDIDASRSWSVPLDTAVIDRSTRKVNEHINRVVYAGDSVFGFKGLLGASGVTAISGTTTITANKFIGYMNSIPRKFRSAAPYSLVVADVEWKELVKIGNNYNDKSVATQITEAVGNLTIVNEANLDEGTALASGTLAAGTALLVPNKEDWVFLPLGKSPRSTQTAFDHLEEVKGTVNARFGQPALPHPTSVGKITGLQTA